MKLLPPFLERAFGNPLLMIREYIPESIKKWYRLIRAKLLSIGLARSGTFDQPEDEVKASKDISVIVPIYDPPPEVTARFLDSLGCYAGNAEVILVKDGSRLQETINLINEAQRRNGWKVISHEKRLGHSRCCETGSKVATRKYLCFLNSDTVVSPWSWWAAKEAFEADPRIAVTGPTTSWAATKQKIPRAMYCRYYWTNSQIYAFAKKYISNLTPRAWVDLPMVAGFAFFIRRSIWEEFGGFDPNLPNYGNETELCKRLSNQGFRLIWTQNSYIHHFGKADYEGIMGEVMISQKRLVAKAYIDRLHRQN